MHDLPPHLEELFWGHVVRSLWRGFISAVSVGLLSGFLRLARGGRSHTLFRLKVVETALQEDASELSANGGGGVFAPSNAM